MKVINKINSIFLLLSFLFLPLNFASASANEVKEDYLVKVDNANVEIPGVELQDLDLTGLNSEESNLWKRVINPNYNEIKTLENNPFVEYAHPEIEYKLLDLPNDSFYNSFGTITSGEFDQWNLRKIGLLPVEDVPSFESGWDYSTGSSDTIVAVIDSGVDLTHPDLQGNLVPGRNFSSSTAYPGSTNVADELGHGTHVAGIIAGVTNNSSGIASVCWNCKIMPIKVFANVNSTTDVRIYNAINYAVDNGAHIINLSLSGNGFSQLVQDAVNYAWDNGVTVIAAAGNESDDASLYTPASLKRVITVGATTRTDALAGFSNFGPRIDITAPGVSILSTKLRSLGGANCVSSTDYFCMNGTSMSAPHVTGVAALLYDMHKDDAEPWTNIDIRNAILKNIEDTGSVGFDILFGFGRLNALKALESDNSDLNPSPPVVSLNSPTAEYFSNNISLTGSITSSDLYIYTLIFSQSGNTKYIYSDRGNVNNSDLIGYSLGLADGIYDVTLSGEDFSGTITNSSPVSVNVDLTAPASFSIGKSIAETNATFTFSTTDAKSGVDHYEVAIDNGSFTTQTSPYTTPTLGNGDYTFKVKAIDKVGNERLVETSFSIYSRAYMLKSVGDLTGNGIVDLQDLSILATFWNQTTSNGDINSDGKVNISDLSILATNWMKSF